MGLYASLLPVSMDDFMDVLAKCKEAYPDMIPYGLGGFWKFQILESLFGAYQGAYDPETGDYYYEASAPGYKEAMAAANKMAREGYVTAEAYANENEADGHQAAYNNGCVFYTWYLSYTNLSQLQTETAKINPDAEWALVPKFTDAAPSGKSIGWAGAFVSRNCQNPLHGIFHPVNLCPAGQHQLSCHHGCIYQQFIIWLFGVSHLLSFPFLGSVKSPALPTQRFRQFQKSQCQHCCWPLR